jgi:DNA-binding IclR family transcriptional regulator
MNGTRVPGQQSVRRAVDVLFCFDRETPSLTVGAVGARLGMNRTTAWRYLHTLCDTGLVRELGAGRFGLGARAVRLAEGYTGEWGEFEPVAGAALVRLRDRVGETAALHLRQGWSRVVVRQVESRHELHRTYRDLGEPISLLEGAPSRAILAALPAQEVQAYLDAYVAEADRSRVAAELDRVRAAGHARSLGARTPNVASVAAAIRAPDGQVVAALNVTGPDHRFNDELFEFATGEVRTAAAWVEERLAQGSATPSDPRPDQGERA